MTLQSDAAYVRLKADIVLGALAPGSEHTEVMLAQNYQMGRAAIRVALTRLGEIGLVSAVPRRGFVVAPITANSIRDLFETRLVIEPQTARLATNNVDVAVLRAIDQPVPANASAAQRLEFLDANHRFHQTIAESTGNARLTRISSDLLDEMRRLINLGLFGDATQTAKPADQQRQQHQHAELIQAFVERNGDAAAAIALEHIETSYAMARERLFDRSLNLGITA